MCARSRIELSLAFIQGTVCRLALCLPDGSRMPGTLALPGRHNVQNALAAASVGWQVGVDPARIVQALEKFQGIGRRFNLLAELTTAQGATVQLVDDYGHHPVEITAVLKAARQVTATSAGGRVIAVVQPHRYTRLRDLLEEFSTSFSDADSVIVADVYPAGEAPIAGVDKHALVDGVRRYGHRHVQALENAAVLPRLIREEAKAGDLVVLLGAGDITAWAYALPAQLEALS